MFALSLSLSSLYPYSKYAFKLYKERGRERERERYTYLHTYIHKYIHTYICMYVCMSRTGQSPGALRAQHTCLYIASPPERLRGCYKHEGERAKKERPCCPVPVACQGKTSLACTARGNKQGICPLWT